MPDRKARPRNAGADGVLRRHWNWRPDWTRGRRSWWWYVTFESHPEVRRLAAEARTAIRPEAPVDVVPARWLHLTLAEVGYVDAFPRRLAYECARRAQDGLADLSPVDLQVGPVATMPGAVVLRASADGLKEVYDHLVAATLETLPTEPVQRPFDPHVSVAYVDRDCRPTDVLDAEALDRREPVWTRIDRVSLVEVTRRQRHYQWTPRCQLSLRGRSQRRLVTDG